MRIRRKRKKCLNCGISLTETDNYCAYCGQENTDTNVSFSTLVGDFFNNYFSFDSKFFRSFKPFLIKPGFLTNQYNLGKRASYIHPLRLYLVISLFYFFILSLILSAEVSDEPLNFMPNDPEEAAIADSLLQITQVEIDSLGSRQSLNNINTKINIDQSKLGLGVELAKNRDISDEAILDSLNIENKSDFNRYLVHQGRKVLIGEVKPFLMYAIKNFPIMMFLAVPIFALILKLLYIRRKMLYVTHLIHALHLHAFSYFFYGLSIVLYYYFYSNDNIIWISFLLVSGYTYFSFLRVYNQRKIKTFLKFLMLGYMYLICLLFFVLGELAISFFLF